VTSFLFKGDRPGEDPIFALNQEASARIARGESVVNATIGVLLEDDGSLAVLHTAARALKQVSEQDWAAYAPIAGTPDFLDAVVNELFRGHTELRTAATAVATPGGTGAVRHTLSTFLEPGQALLTTSYYWGPYAILADEHLRRIETFEMFDPSSGTLNVGALDEKLDEMWGVQRRALIVFNDPCHNPTGYSMTDAEWSAAAAVVARHAERGPVAVLLDAAYVAYGPARLEPALRSFFQPLLGRALLLVAWSASKTFTHYGLRVGSLVALWPEGDERRRIQAALGYACRGTWSNCNRGGMAAITKLLGDPILSAQVEGERARLVKLLGERVTLFNRAASAKGLRFPRYDGGFFVTVFTDDAFGVAEKMRADGVFVVPLKGALRVALASVPAEQIPRLVESLARALGLRRGEQFDKTSRPA
jgi:aromatic-amino-acid transaminase